MKQTFFYDFEKKFLKRLVSSEKSSTFALAKQK